MKEGIFVDISTIILYIKQLFATILTLIMMIVPSSDGAKGVAYESENSQELILSFAAVSDTHVETNNPDSYSAFSQLLYGIKAGKDHDVAVFLGDNVMNGQALENLFFYTAVSAVKPAKTTLVAAGNHDFGNGEGDYDSFRKNYINNNRFYLWNNLDKPYYFKVINGCYMIFLASEDLSVGDFVMSDEQFDWLESVLYQADADEATIFIFNHHPVNHLRSDDSLALAELLCKYDNLLYIHGHIHDYLDKNNFYERNGVICINLPRSTEIVEYEPGDGIVVEVYENEILVRGRDFISGEWLENLEFRYTIG